MEQLVQREERMDGYYRRRLFGSTSEKNNEVPMFFRGNPAFTKVEVDKAAYVSLDRLRTMA